MCKRDTSKTMPKRKQTNKRLRKTEEQFTNGALISPPDARDWQFERLVSAGTRKPLMLHHRKSGLPVTATSLPSKLILTNTLGAVYDQGSMPICAAVVAATCKRWQEHTITNGASFSPMFVYNLRSNAPAEGMHGRDVMQILVQKGCCRKSFYATNSRTLNQKNSISKLAYSDGLHFRLSNYAQIHTIEGLKTALHQYGPCYIAFPMYNSGKEFWKPPKPGTPATSGHAVTVVGYDDEKKAFKIRNSWSVLWNLGGYTWYPYAQFGAHWEIWSLVDGVSPPKLLPPPEPTPLCQCVLL